MTPDNETRRAEEGGYSPRARQHIAAFSEENMQEMDFDNYEDVTLPFSVLICQRNYAICSNTPLPQHLNVMLLEHLTRSDKVQLRAPSCK